MTNPKQTLGASASGLALGLGAAGLLGLGLPPSRRHDLPVPKKPTNPKRDKQKAQRLARKQSR